jgi:multidrug transporter EmrE-like cation transporter
LLEKAACMAFFINHFYIFLSIAFAVCSQLIIKWKMSAITFSANAGFEEKFLTAFKMLFDPFIMLSLLLTLLSGLSWMIAMTKFDISYAYPYTALGYVVILFCSWLLFGEAMHIGKIFGTALIVAGIVIAGRYA